MAGVCADDLADSIGQGLAGAAGYVVVFFHGIRLRLVLGIILSGNDDLMAAVLGLDMVSRYDSADPMDTQVS